MHHLAQRGIAIPGHPVDTTVMKNTEATVTSIKNDGRHDFYRVTVQGAADSDSAIASALDAIGFNASSQLVVHSSARNTKDGLKSVRLTVIKP